MENPIKMDVDDLEVPLFLKPSIYIISIHALLNLCSKLPLGTTLW